MRNYLVLALFMFISFLYIYAINGIEYSEPDTGHYLVLAKSLSMGNGYRQVSHPDNHFEKQYLPVYPILLVPIFWLSNGDYYVARLITVFFSVLTLPIIYLISKKFFEYRLALCSAILMALSPMFVIYSRKILTDIPYLFFFLTFILLIYQYQNSKEKKYFLFSILFLILLLFTRIVGIVVLAVILLYSIIKKQTRDIVILGIVLLFFVLYLFYTNNYWLNPMSDFGEFGPKSEGIVSTEFGRILLERFIGYFFYFIPLNLVSLLNIPIYLYDTSISFQSPIISVNNLVLVLGGLTSTVAIYGLYLSAKKNLRLFEIITIIYTVSVIIEHRVTGNGRYMLPILLFFIIYFIIGLKNIGFFNRRIKHIYIYELILMLLIFSSLGSSILLSIKNHNSLNPETTENYIAISRWISKNTPDDAVIIVSNPQFMYLYSNRKAVEFPGSFSHTEGYIYKYNSSYIVLAGYYDENTNIEYKKQLESDINKFKKRYSLNDQYVIYEVLK